MSRQTGTQFRCSECGKTEMVSSINSECSQPNFWYVANGAFGCRLITVDFCSLTCLRDYTEGEIVRLKREEDEG